MQIIERRGICVKLNRKAEAFWRSPVQSAVAWQCNEKRSMGQRFYFVEGITPTDFL